MQSSSRGSGHELIFSGYIGGCRAADYIDGIVGRDTSKLCQLDPFVAVLQYNTNNKHSPEVTGRALYDLMLVRSVYRKSRKCVHNIQF